jgi:hypothetical protein
MEPTGIASAASDFFARHGVLVIWPVSEFTHALLDTTDPDVVAGVYREFRHIAARAMTDEGADPTPALTTHTGMTR